jgi:hypothetical protein
MPKDIKTHLEESWELTHPDTPAPNGPVKLDSASPPVDFPLAHYCVECADEEEEELCGDCWKKP